MNKFRFTIKALAIAIFTFAFASMAQAQASRTWVSGVGDDVNPCSRTAPCKTFAGAISKTAAGGEIDALDPGGFGAVTITKAITIDGGGGQVASVLVSGGISGIVIQAGASDTVTLLNLRINGVGSGANGIRFLAGKALNVINVYIYGFTSNGIDVALGAAGSQVLVRNTVVKNCGGDGISASTTAGLVKVIVTDSAFQEDFFGIHGRKNSDISVLRCSIGFVGSDGIFAEGNGGPTEINVSKSVISNSLYGIEAGGGGANTTSVIRLNDCDIYDNINNGALVSANGEVDTFGNNRILGNGTNGCPSCTPKTPN